MVLRDSWCKWELQVICVFGLVTPNSPLTSVEALKRGGAHVHAVCWSWLEEQDWNCSESRLWAA